MKTFLLMLATTWLATSIAPTAIADDLAARISACTRERDDAKRLACFDRAASSNASTPTADLRQTFGVQGSELARSREESEAPASSQPKRITASVASIDKRPRGELVLTLDNGQVWAQKEAAAYFPIKVGDAVTILAGTLGSFRLVVGSRATAVTRVQ